MYKRFKHHKVYIDLTKVSLLLPGLVFWIKNYKFAALPTDPTFIPALLTILACFSENMQHEFNIPRKKFTFLKFSFAITDSLSENQNRFGIEFEKTWNSVILCSIYWFILYYKCSSCAIRDSYRYLDPKSKGSAQFYQNRKSRFLMVYKNEHQKSKSVTVASSQLDIS